MSPHLIEESGNTTQGISTSVHDIHRNPVDSVTSNNQVENIEGMLVQKLGFDYQTANGNEAASNPKQGNALEGDLKGDDKEESYALEGEIQGADKDDDEDEFDGAQFQIDQEPKKKRKSKRKPKSKRGKVIHLVHSCHILIYIVD